MVEISETELTLWYISDCIDTLTEMLIGLKQVVDQELDELADQED